MSIPITAFLNTKPFAEFLPHDPAGCTPFEVSFNNLTSNATDYQWDFGDGETSSEQNPVHTFINNTFGDVTYNVTLVASNGGCYDTVETQVLVHPLPQANFSFDNTPACSPHTIEFTNESSGAVTYEWIYGDGTQNDTVENPVHTFYNDTTFIQYYNVRLVAISEYGCADTTSGIATVYPNPDVNLNVEPDSLCLPGVATLTANPGYVSYEWNFGDSVQLTTATNHIDHFYPVLGDTTEIYHLWVRAISPLGCVDTSYADLVMFPTPNADFSPDVTSACGSYNLQLVNNSTGAVMYIWEYGDGSVDTVYNAGIQTHYYENNSNAPTTFNIILRAINQFGCEDTLERSFVLYPALNAEFSVDTVGCSPFTVQFDNLTNGASSYHWDFGDGTVSTDEEPYHTYVNVYSNPVEYDVSLIVTSGYGCVDTATTIITVYPSPDAQFSVSPTVMTLPNSTVHLNNLTSGTNWNCLWLFGNGDSSNVCQPGEYTYNSAGNYTIMLIVSNDYCSDTAMQAITINPGAPDASFEVDTNEGCVPLVVNFNNTSTGGNQFYWNFGDGYSSTEHSPQHIYNESGMYNAQLIVNGEGGTDTYSTMITVHPSPTAFFKVVPTQVSVPGEAIKCYNQSDGATSFLWDFGDSITSTLENPTHEYTTPGTYTITLTVWNEYGCQDKYQKDDAVIAVSAGEIIFPNAFTPNPSGPNGGYYDPNDFSNDVFHPVYRGVVEYELQIFNRWGELIFVSKDPKIGWDGYYRGKLCKQDVYVWKVKVKFSNGEVIEKVGDVTLLR
jgi:gliding motility-associated-like protein